MINFPTKINSRNRGDGELHFTITIPKKLVDAHIIDPTKEYDVILEERK